MKEKMLHSNYEQLIDNPMNIVGDMSYDEYCDWLDLGTKEDLEATLEKFKSTNSYMPQDYICILKLKLNSL